MPGVSSSQNAPNFSNEVINNANDQPRKVIQDSADYMDLLEKAHINPCMTKCGKCDSCVVKLGYEKKVDCSLSDTDKMAEQFESLKIKNREENTDSKKPEQSPCGIVQNGNGKPASHQRKPRGSLMNDSINHATSSSILCQLKTENSEGGMRNSPPAIFPTNIKVKRTVIFTTVNPFPKIPDAPMLLSRRERTAANRRARQRVVPSAPPLEDEDDETVQ
ncbi:hypothetical protein GCK72_023565 [Caenorhabditis remanei]|uniref:Uncharacterized protein n=1 Tax=Caenorhabditis remanei TaxID=31234 RepID=A0A6A5FWY0_CAERE|nr:hypothetical protein GCK72_023565 [Caenorhabditis remanei]KAF1747106.1 hypothetical protein GCK72_023565 [Caenorhabditis remanei]